jgi:uncharacterized DUF497 family protein
VQDPPELLFEWDPAKARANVRWHGVSFEQAASAFYDDLAATIQDPDHSALEQRELLIGFTADQRLTSLVTPSGVRGSESSVLDWPRGMSDADTNSDSQADEMRAEYDFSKAVRGKYAERARKGSNVVVIEDDLKSEFPNSESVNAALRELIRRRRAEGAA